MLDLPTTVRAFMDRYGETLYNNELSAQLILRNAVPNLEMETSPACAFGAYVSEGQPELIFCRVLPYNLVLFAACDNVSETAMRTIAAYALERLPDLRGVNGPTALVNAFRAYTMEKQGRTIPTHTAMSIMRLTKVANIPMQPGRMRRPGEADIPLLASFMLDFKRAIHDPNTDTWAEEAIRERLASQTDYLWESPEGKVVCWVGCKPGGAQKGESVGPVYTPPEERCKGWAKTLVATVCRQRLDAGVDYISLFVDNTNPYSNAAYRRVGFEVVEDCIDARFEDNVDAHSKDAT